MRAFDEAVDGTGGICDTRTCGSSAGGNMGTHRRLEIDGISKRYGETVALQDLGFAVRAGELFGFVGRNGAGKTTTMRIALGVLAPDAGEVWWDGVPLDFAARRRIG
jgi:ABC-2 type transport system ATP-binding protein